MKEKNKTNEKLFLVIITKCILITKKLCHLLTK
jgi:hypothetical protein